MSLLRSMPTLCQAAFRRRSQCGRPVGMTSFLFVALCLISGGSCAAGTALPLRFTLLAECTLPPESESAQAEWRTTLPAGVREADGRDVRLTGYMWPVRLVQGQVTEFILMRNQNGCCYGQMPAANEYVVVTVAEPVLPRLDIPVTVVGTWRVSPVIFGGTTAELFRIERATLLP